MADREAISVALCTYNGERFLGEQLRSIARQTLLPAELVVTDDGSTDGTVALVEAFARVAAFPVELHVNRVNLGSTASFEQTVAACRHPLVVLCDQDDVWRPNKLDRLAAALAAQPDAGYAFSDADLVDEALRPLGRCMWETVGMTAEARKDFSGTRQVEVLLERAIVTGATMMLRARDFDLARPIPSEAVHDQWIAMTFSAIGAWGIPVPEPLIAYRQHAGQQIGAYRQHAGQQIGQPKRSGWTQRFGRAYVLDRRAKLVAGAQTIRRFTEALDRLASTDALSDPRRRHARSSLALATQRARHIDARAALDVASVTQIVRTLVEELGRGAYGRYSGGLAALGADLLYCLLYRHPRPGNGSAI